MILKGGEKLLVLKSTHSGHLMLMIGEVDSYLDGIIKVKGRCWKRNPGLVEFTPFNDIYTKVFSVSSEVHSIYELPSDTIIGNLRFLTTADGKLVVTDGLELSMAIPES